MKLNHNIFIQILVMCISFSHGKTFAQESLTIEDALALARQNISLATYDKMIEVAKLNTETVQRFLPTTFIVDYGQINSRNMDNKIGITQSMLLPAAVNSQKQWLQHEIEHTQFQKEVSLASIQNNVLQHYYSMIYWQQLKKLYLEADSVWQEAVSKQDNRLLLGEANVMDQTIANSQWMEIKQMLQTINMEIQYTSRQMNYLLNTDKKFNLTSNRQSLILITERLSIDTTNLMLQAIEHERHINHATIAIERAKLLPVLNLGYSNGTFKGIGPDDQYYSIASRFSAFTLGIEIPLFRKAQQNKIAAIKANYQVLDSKYAHQKWQLDQQWQSLHEQRDALSQSHLFYTEHVLANAHKMLQSANLQLQEGQINFIEWAFLYRQNMDINIKYIDLEKKLTDNLIQMIYITSKSLK